MSKYTTELRFICEDYAGVDESKGYNNVQSIIETARPKVFDFDYPIFDASYRNVLENKILKHFYLREICTETVGVWKLFLNTRMNEIMPYYNKLYESELIEFNPLYDTDLTRDYNKDGKGTGTISDAFSENDERVISETEEIDRVVAETDTDALQIAQTEVVDRTDSKSGTDTGYVDTEDKGTVGKTNTGTDNKTNTGTITTGTTGTVVTDKDVSGSNSSSEANQPKNTRWDIYSDTPQGALTNVENETYLTNARKIVDDATGSSKTNSGTVSETTDVTETTNGSVTETRNLADNETLNLAENETRNLTGKETRHLANSLDEDEDINTTTNRSENDTKTIARNDTENRETNRNDTDEKTSNNLRTRNIRDLEDYIEHVKGKTGGVSFSKLLQEFRDTFLNIDMMIINDLNDLFFGLW